MALGTRGRSSSVGFTLRPRLAAVALAHRPGSPSTRDSFQLPSRTTSRRIRRCLGASALQRLLSTAKDRQIRTERTDIQEEHKGPAFTMNVHTTELPFVRFLSDVLRLHCRSTRENGTDLFFFLQKEKSTLDGGLQCTFLHATTRSYAQLRHRPLSSVALPPFAFPLSLLGAPPVK